jgi:CRP-like cAMP-binding protein
MSRSDIAEFVGTSLETVGRTFRRLVSRSASAFSDRRHVKILDPALLQSIIAEPRGEE